LLEPIPSALLLKHVLHVFYLALDSFKQPNRCRFDLPVFLFRQVIPDQ
jgi:hypothetical protein